MATEHRQPQASVRMASVQAVECPMALLRRQLAATEAQLTSLRQQLQQHADAGAVEDSAAVPRETAALGERAVGAAAEPATGGARWPLRGHEYTRYGRQMVMAEVGLRGQLRLRQARVLVVGVGGLGCPAAAYLAGAGVGTLGLMDGDVVELSNLHRQLAHTTANVGQSKVDSACQYLRELNPLVTYQRHHFHLAPENALAVFAQYDLVLDCTDHPTSRYLISDACVLAQRPLVSASALKTEGQLILLNNPPRPPGDASGGPCYRCLFPKPPPPDAVLSCGDGGVLGPVVGVMGVLQALEAIKVLTAQPQARARSSSERGHEPIVGTTPPPRQIPPEPVHEPGRPTLLIFSAYSHPPFRSVRMRTRHAACAACSSRATITHNTLNSRSLDYAAFCGLTHPVDILPPSSRISASDFARLARDGSNTVLIDTRDETQYHMCALRGSVNVPWTGSGEAWLEKAVQAGALAGRAGSYYVVCRNGNDSQLAAKAIMDFWRANGEDAGGGAVVVKDIKGGFRAWREEVDGEWPDY